MQIDRRRADILVLDDALDEAERTRVLQAISAARFEEQQLGPRMMGRARERAIVEDPALAELLWSVLRGPVGEIAGWFPALPITGSTPIGNWSAFGCNPRSRLYRYGRGADFSLHYDEPWRPAPNVRSLLTVLLYLPAGGCTGGETIIDGETVQVADWRIAAFDHRLQHEGRPVESGAKFVLRNDIVARANSS